MDLEVQLKAISGQPIEWEFENLPTVVGSAEHPPCGVLIRIPTLSRTPVLT